MALSTDLLAEAFASSAAAFEHCSSTTLCSAAMAVQLHGQKV